MWWCIYYENGRFSDDDGSPWEAPRLGVIAIAQYDRKVGYRIIHGEDYYYFEEDRDGWVTCDLISAFDHLERAPVPLVLRGRMINRHDYDELLTKIRLHYGDKQGWLKSERKPAHV